MAHTIPFFREPFTPKTIQGNAESDVPVVFFLSSAGGPDLARIKSILYASINLTHEANWTPEVARNVASAFASGSDLFVSTVEKIQGLTVPAALARKVGLDVDAKAKDDTEIPVTTGTAFARVARYSPLLAFEVAMEISRITKDEQIDPRLFPSLTTSPETPAGTSGNAPSVRNARARRGTADGPTTPAGSVTTSERHGSSPGPSAPPTGRSRKATEAAGSSHQTPNGG